MGNVIKRRIDDTHCLARLINSWPTRSDGGKGCDPGHRRRREVMSHGLAD
jgi:hypothetical protein